MCAGQHSRVVASCRVCGGSRLETVLSLGETPLANAFVAPERLAEPEESFPLDLVRCLACGLVQLSVTVAPEFLFSHYLYASSASVPLLAHFQELADDLVPRFAGTDALVVEIGSNDGVLLRPLKERGVRALGVEPASNIAADANAQGLETLNAFFSADIARRIRSERGGARVVVGTNVLAHIDELHSIATAISSLLDRDGVFVAEVPYLTDLIDHVEYDTIYHEHLSYFHLTPLQHLFRSAGMELFDVQRLPIHGGSVRIYAAHSGARARSARLDTLLAEEKPLMHPAVYQRFASRVRESRDALRRLLAQLIGERRSIAALGATAKGNTLLNYCQIGPDVISFVADSTRLKHGLLTPGMHIPVRPEPELLAARPDYVLLLAWNYADAIVRRYRDYLDTGGRFIHPIPIARVIES